MLRRSTSVCKLILGLRLWGMSTKECFIRMRSYTVPRTTARCGRVMRMESVVSMRSYLEHWLRPHKEVLSQKAAQLEGCRALVHETSWSIKVIGPIITRELSSVNSLPLKDVLETYHSSCQTGNITGRDGLCKDCPNTLDTSHKRMPFNLFCILAQSASSDVLESCIHSFCLNLAPFKPWSTIGAAGEQAQMSSFLGMRGSERW